MIYILVGDWPVIMQAGLATIPIRLAIRWGGYLRINCFLNSRSLSYEMVVDAA